MLQALGVSNNASVVSRGTGQGLITTGGATVSESGAFIGNSNGDDVKNKTMTDATDSAKAQTAEAVDESDETKLKDVYAEVVDIYKILQDIAYGNYTLAVDVKNPVLRTEQMDLGL